MSDLSDWDWQDNAACRGLPTVLFFGPEGEQKAARLVREKKARKVCSACPSRAECLDYALSRPERFGTWGGLNPDQRSAEKRRRARKSTKTKTPVEVA